MIAYKEGQTVIVSNEGVNQVGMILGNINANKQTLYDVFLETRSVIIAVPRNDTSKRVYIDDTLTKLLASSKKIKSTLPDYDGMVEDDTLPAFREHAIGPRSF